MGQYIWKCCNRIYYLFLHQWSPSPPHLRNILDFRKGLTTFPTPNSFKCDAASRQSIQKQRWHNGTAFSINAISQGSVNFLHEETWILWMNPSLPLPRNQVIQSFEKWFLRSQWLPRLPKTGKLLLTTSKQPNHASLSSKSCHIVNPIKCCSFSS